MHQKIATKDLKSGMFIADLDRPWIDTPFLLQGFLLDDDEQMQQLRLHCQWVMIDPQRSVGQDFDTPAKKAAFVPRDLGAEPRVMVKRSQQPAVPGNGQAPAPWVTFGGGEHDALHIWADKRRRGAAQLPTSVQGVERGLALRILTACPVPRSALMPPG